MDKQSENEAYWAARATAYEEAWHNRCQTTVERDLAAYYEQALADIQRDIAALYGRFAKDNKLSMAEAHRLLTGDEYRVWRMSMEEYLQGIENGSVLSEELDTLAMRSRISRLDKLYAETLKALDRLGRKTEDRMTDFLMDAYKDRFYHGIYDVAERTGIMKANVAIDDDTAQKSPLLRGAESPIASVSGRMTSSSARSFAQSCRMGCTVDCPSLRWQKW